MTGYDPELVSPMLPASAGSGPSGGGGGSGQSSIIDDGKYDM